MEELEAANEGVGNLVHCYRARDRAWRGAFRFVNRRRVGNLIFIISNDL